MLKQIHLSIPLVDMLCEVQKYEKYIKDIVANKRRLTEFKTSALTEECTSRIKHKLPQKLKDPARFTIPVRIAEIDVVFKQLGLGAPRPTTVLLHLADRSYVYPGRVIEDVLLQIGKFIFPADFIILDYEADESGLQWISSHSVASSLRDDLSMIFVVKINEPAVEPSAFKEDALEKTLMLFNYLELEQEVVEMLQILDASCEYIRERSQFEPLDRPIGLPPRPSVGEEEKLLRVRREHNHAIGWTMSDIKDYSKLNNATRKDHFPLPFIDQMLDRCEETNLVLNWEECHFMVGEGIVLGNKVSKDGLEVDKAKVEAIEKLLENDAPFKFDDACLKAFEEVKKKLVSAPIIVAPDLKEPFELMCDASDGAIVAVLGQRSRKSFHSIYCASKTVTPAQIKYTVTEKGLVVVVLAFDKFRAYLVGTKVIVYTYHAIFNYLFEKKDAKPRLISWVLLLLEFDLEIRD
uniref:Reverse transcriptase RNase H-like domain-containing protein n=1 Tax=Nicotiana tabacum TaxID=4097 RepID=A0A1S4BGY0_TOBAC